MKPPAIYLALNIPDLSIRARQVFLGLNIVRSTRSVKGASPLKSEPSKTERLLLQQEFWKSHQSTKKILRYFLPR